MTHDEMEAAIDFHRHEMDVDDPSPIGTPCGSCGNLIQREDGEIWVEDVDGDEDRGPYYICQACDNDSTPVKGE